MKNFFKQHNSFKNKVSNNNKKQQENYIQKKEKKIQTSIGELIAKSFNKPKKSAWKRIRENEMKQNPKSVAKKKRKEKRKQKKEIHDALSAVVIETDTNE